jgi:hypothetical protein
MALITGGGVGNPAGSNPAGIGSGFNYLGQHAYAYSGSIAVGGSLTTMLDFTTGANSYWVGDFRVEGAFDDVAGSTIQVKVSMDGQTIMLAKTTEDRYGDRPEISLLIPPQTRVHIEAFQNTGGDLDFQAILVGRVYE